MRQYSVEHSSVECRWIYKRMIPSLPGPGTPAFARLVKGLQPFGITPESVSVDAPSSRLSDVVLGIVLLERRVVVRITAESFDLFVTALCVGDDETLIEIANLVLAAIGDIDDETTKANAKIRTSSHLKLVSAEADEFLSEHLKLGISIAGLTPDAAAYKVGSVDNLHSSDLRIVIAKSIGYDNSVFVDMTANYSDAPPAGTLAAWVSSDFEVVTELLGLQEMKEAK